MKFEKPIAEIIFFEDEDVIVTSIGGNGEGGNNPGGKDDMDD